MTSELHPDDLLPAYVLEVLSDGELAQVKQHLARCARCQQAVAEYRQVTNLLPLVVPEVTLPPSLRANILAQADREAQDPAPARGGTSHRSLFRSLNGWLAAAVLLVVSLGMAGWNVSLQSRLSAAMSQPRLTAALAATADGQGARGNVVVDNGAAPVLTVNALKVPPAGFVYEAWVIGGAGALPAGTFTTTPDGHGDLVLTQGVTRGNVVAITTEPAPGVQAPTGKILLKGVAP